MRVRYRFAGWALSVMPTAVVRYRSTCLTCGERRADTASAADAELWCLQHAEVERHTAFELAAFQYFDAAKVDPLDDSEALTS